MLHFLDRAAQDRHFQAVPFAKVDVQARHDKFVMVMLFVDQFRGQLASVVIVDEHEDGNNFAGGSRRLLVDEFVANKVADRLAPVRIALRFDVLLSNAVNNVLPERC